MSWINYVSYKKGSHHENLKLYTWIVLVQPANQQQKTDWNTPSKIEQELNDETKLQPFNRLLNSTSQRKVRRLSFHNRIIWKGDPSESRVDLQSWKTADSVWFSLFTRYTGKCNIPHASWHQLERYSAFRYLNPNSPKGPENVKITTLYRCTWRRFTAATWHIDSK